MVGQVVPEPFDVRTEHAVVAGALVFDNPMTHGFDSSTDSKSKVCKVVAFKQQQKHLTCMTSYQSLVLSVVPVYMDFIQIVQVLVYGCFSSPCRWK